MQYHDPIHGPVTIEAPLLLDLLASQSVQRLKHVLQHGITALLGITQPITRYEHSLGVMILVQRLGGSLQEQAAALLHDISHTAFSHVIDHVFRGPEDDSYHERKKAEYIALTDLPTILARYGIDWQHLLNDESYPLLEQPAPRLCADRVDYFLRDASALGLLTAETTSHICRHLTVREGRIVVSGLEVARLMAYCYLQADETSWSNPTEVGLYELTALGLRQALQKGLIRENDLWTGDADLWAHLREADDPELQATLALVARKPTFVISTGPGAFPVRPKVRTIDPDVITEHGLARLSELDAEFARFREDYLARKSTGFALRMVPCARD